ncbi:MAG: hypothetical protein ACREFY_06920 [Acetobacteraceae bacterium]
MDQDKQGQKPETERKESVLTDKEKFGTTEAGEELKHMGEKAREPTERK